MQFGFKKLLLISIAVLVAMSVSLTSYFSYVKEENALTSLIMKENSEFVQQQAKIIEKQLNEKALGLARLPLYIMIYAKRAPLKILLN